MYCAAKGTKSKRNFSKRSCRTKAGKSYQRIAAGPALERNLDKLSEAERKKSTKSSKKPKCAKWSKRKLGYKQRCLKRNH